MSAHPDAKRSQLRALVASMDRAVDVTSRAASEERGAIASTPLHQAWRALVVALDLGPEPETRACPRCGALAMKLATRCGHCWATLTPA